MAKVDKYNHQAFARIIRHNSREGAKSLSNPDIDPKRSGLNYSLCEGRWSLQECREYYRSRLSQVYVYGKGRKDINTLCQWVITAPRDLAEKDEKAFFQAAHDYCCSLYGEQNCIQSIVHKDEGIKDADGRIIAGRPHMHFSFIPVVKNKKYMQKNRYGHISGSGWYQEKVCANEVLTLAHLKSWHTNFQKFLIERGIQAAVINGSTAEKNFTVEELKSHTKDQIIHELEAENSGLKAKVHDLDQSHQQSKEKTAAWSHSSGWAKEVNQSWEKEY